MSLVTMSLVNHDSSFFNTKREFVNLALNWLILKSRHFGHPYLETLRESKLSFIQATCNMTVLTEYPQFLLYMV